ncbi:hypothetical protein GGI04_000535 [Coemansia thaxteri]|uniref:PCI domain-containing protein n=1 Tax=Coemansia thaxteri TaxID=2663907 RepID=A0A9W8BIC3_9FUNG|nr:hypothetical protein H4R26_002679 [Coemansia thaxteri]KAJ2009330.1 hypothetical protein GGI04_000535 [Coemansia thaxteri]KAJ2474086.1 hypothetical protein GGI02_000358 [Coemansia sp. RSA 2322]KAJ2482752.1 hypothetical protein EV174_003131 [Coemansia sp. RSA 2320]
MGAKDVIFIDGDVSGQISELARYIGELSGASDIEGFVAGITGSESAEAAAEAVLQASLGGTLARAPEAQMEAAYSQLFAIVASSGGDASLSGAAAAVADDVAAHAESGVAALRVLNSLYELVDGATQARVFEAMVATASRTDHVALVAPAAARLTALMGAWGSGAGRAVLALRRALDAAQLSAEAFASEVALLGSGDCDDATAAEVAASAVVRLANVPALVDVDALAGLPRVQELSRRGALGDAGRVLDALVASDYAQWTRFAADNAAQLTALGVDAGRAAHKMRLLTVASVAADSLGHAVPFADVASAIDVPAEDVEMWVIDAIRAGLIQGKMNQIARTLLPTRSTYRTFGSEHWTLLASRLDQWKTSLDSLRPVVNNAKLVAQQNALQMAGQSRVTIKE